MDEFISREATIKRIEEVYCADCNSYHGVRCRACGTGDAIDIIEDAPTADVAPVVHGRWVTHYRSGTPVAEGYVSTCCDMWNNRKSDYCPNCGAKMDGKEVAHADDHD